MTSPDEAGYMLRQLARGAVRRRGPWKRFEDVEFATLEWVHWFDHQRLLEPIGHVPPVEFEAEYRRLQAGQTLAA